jgi:CDGSH-type Zn-finger protein
MESKDAVNYLIVISENGPYIVTGGVPLLKRTPAYSVHGEPLEWDQVGDKKDRPTEAGERYELCRCGKSANKPFCDRSHETNGFRGPLTADREPTSTRWRVVEGGDIQFTDDTSLCSSAGFCGLRFANIWTMIKRADDPEVQARIMRMVRNCPSGRLVLYNKDGEPLEPEFIPSIAEVPNGPLWVRGGIRIQAPDGFVYEVRNRVTLCRCGESKNMPFCDGTHEKIEFSAP